MPIQVVISIIMFTRLLGFLPPLSLFMCGSVALGCLCMKPALIMVLWVLLGCNMWTIVLSFIQLSQLVTRKTSYHLVNYICNSSLFFFLYDYAVTNAAVMLLNCCLACLNWFVRIQAKYIWTPSNPRTLGLSKPSVVSYPFNTLAVNLLRIQEVVDHSAPPGCICKI